MSRWIFGLGLVFSDEPISPFSFSTITRLTFGSEVRAMTTATGSEYTDRFERWMAGAAKMSAMLQLLGKWAYILIPSVVKQWKEDGDAMFGLVRGEMARVRRGEARNSILDDTMAHLAAGAKESGTMTDAQLELACMSLLFGGHDTTSALLGFLTYELSKRPDIQKGLRDELATLPAGPIDSLEPLESLPLLNAVIKETLRKYPSAPFGATRNMYEPYTHEYIGVDGTPRRIEFRKGDRLITYIWGIQRWPGFWEKDPEEWAPERFLENPSGDTKVGLYAYSPFGNGARRCLGERLALGEARLTVASIVRRWEIVPAFGEGEAFEELYQGTIRPSKVMIKLVEVANKA